jgi:hypothetical protein
MERHVQQDMYRKLLLEFLAAREGRDLDDVIREYQGLPNSTNNDISIISNKLHALVETAVARAPRYEDVERELMLKKVSVRKIPEEKVAQHQSESYNWVRLDQPGYYEFML